MAFALSPGVTVVEKDFTSIVPAVGTSTGAFAGEFQWGPVSEPTTIPSENELVRRFGKPESANADSFFTASNFLAYTSNLIVVRTDSALAKNAVALTTGSVSTFTLVAGGSGYETIPDVSIGAPDLNGGIQATATAVLSGAEITGISVGDGGSAYTVAPTVVIEAPQVSGGVQAVATAVLTGDAVTSITIDVAGSGYTSAPIVSLVGGDGTGATTAVVTIGASTVTEVTLLLAGSGYTSAPVVTFTSGTGTGADFTAVITTGVGVKIKNEDDYTTNYANGAGLVGEFAAKYPGVMGNSLKVSVADSASYATWAYKDEFDGAPSTTTFTNSLAGSNDELHMVVIDEDGIWTGSQGAILEKFAFVSKASDAKKYDGSNNYYKEVLNRSSQYVWWMDHPSAVEVSGSDWGTPAANTTFKSLTAAVTRSLTGAVDDLSSSDGEIMSGWTLLEDPSLYDISLIPLGKASPAVAIHVIGIADIRKDCVVFVSPQDVTTGDVIVGSTSAATVKVNAYRDAVGISSSYAVMDSGYKYQYDRYNDLYRWVPLNGDIAGLCARTDYTNEPWFSPSGINRGQIKNLIKLAFNPSKTDRDNLYKNGVNPVVTFPGQGTVLFGDKTLLAKPSAFDRINVRRLFIVLEKAIAKAAESQLFEMNDDFTRAQFKNIVEPFLRGVQGKRGITDFVVKCDANNNTGEVIDRNEFVGDIFIKPTRSINFITLNFVAARTGINFSEIGG